MVAAAPLVCAVDIDIREFTVVGPMATTQTGDIATAALCACQHDIVLIEVASAICYHGDSKAASSSVARWQIWNSISAGMLSVALCVSKPSPCVLVSPSSKWTMGYSEADRHALAGITPIKHNKNGVPLFEHNHDIRECMAMLWSYSVKPKLWIPITEYLENI